MLAENDEAVGDWVPCASHKMQSCIKDTMKAGREFDILFKRAEALNSVLKTANGGKLLREARAALGQRPLKAVSFVETRWNSRCTMAIRLLEHTEAITQIAVMVQEPGTPNVYQKFWKDNQALLLSEVQYSNPNYCIAKCSCLVYLF
jgi:hypothetical protein